MNATEIIENFDPKNDSCIKTALEHLKTVTRDIEDKQPLIYDLSGWTNWVKTRVDVI